jgi:hypothetical protein
LAPIVKFQITKNKSQTNSKNQNSDLKQIPNPKSQIIQSSNPPIAQSFNPPIAQSFNRAILEPSRNHPAFCPVFFRHKIKTNTQDKKIQGQVGIKSFLHVCFDNFVSGGKEDDHKAEHVEIFPADDQDDETDDQVDNTPEQQPAHGDVPGDVRVLDVLPEYREEVYDHSQFQESISKTCECLA